MLLCSALVVIGTNTATADTTPTVPGAPTGLTATPGGNQVTLSWIAPDDGGQGHVIYQVYQDGTPLNLNSISGTSVVIMGLTNGVGYSFSVEAYTFFGDVQSSAVLVTPNPPVGTPSAPTGLTAVRGINNATLSWTAPVSEGSSAIDYYIIYEKLINQENPMYWTELPDHPTGLTATADTFYGYGMMQSKTYNFMVAAHNSAGTGAKTDIIIVNPLILPSAPQAYITPGNGQVSIEVTDDHDYQMQGTGPGIDYFVIYQDNVDIRHVTGSFDTVWNETITGLTNGQTYDISVAAHNEAGIGPHENSKEIPMATPDAPTGLTATPGNGRVLLSWNPPANSGESFINGYNVYQDGAMVIGTNNTSTSVTIAPLINGHTYKFSVAAYNALNIQNTYRENEGARSFVVSATPGPENSSEPTGLVATPGNGQVALSWSSPGYNGGVSIDQFVVYQDDIDVKHVTGSSVMITGLSNGQSYTFNVAAQNSVGMGPNSSVVQSTPYTVPDAPTGFAGVLGSGKITLNWTAPVFDGGRAIDYYVVYQNGAALPYHLSGPSTIISGLIKGQTYSFTVSAHNLAGLSQQSSTVSTTASGVLTAPGTPTGLVAVPGSNKVSLKWTAPISNGGTAIDYYIVYQNGTSIAHPTSTSQIATGLVNGVSYTFNVVAHNSAGNGSRSSSVSATPIALTATPTVPDAPIGLVSTPGNGQVSLSWASPINNGGTAIDYYMVYLNGIVGSTHYTTTSATITGLTNDQQYSFAITAHNSVGESSKSSALTVSPTNVAKVPGVPIGLTATPGNDQITLSWASPNNNGGTAIDYYIVYQDSTDISHTAATSENITGLSNGQSYSYSVAAHNSIGIGTQTSSVTATPTINAVPGIPTDLNTTAGSGKVTLNWTSPSGNSSIDYYIVYQNGVDVGHTSATSATITGLTNGENYTFTVAAHNAGGAGAQSSTQISSPSLTAKPTTDPIAPGIPTNLLTVAGNGKVTLSWTPPSGNSSIDYYIIYQNGVDISHTPATSVTITGLTNGESYTFTVAAHNAAGVGIQSSAQSNSPSSSNSAVASAGDNIAYLSIGLAALIAAIIAGFIVVRRNRKKEQ